MLFVSSQWRTHRYKPSRHAVSISESRCFSFQVKSTLFLILTKQCRFQSRNRDAFRFKFSHNMTTARHHPMFQSRNRDAFRFKMRINESPSVPIAEMFQSRNRDAFRFKRATHFGCSPLHLSFNLGIEMLFVSRNLRHR